MTSSPHSTERPKGMSEHYLLDNVLGRFVDFDGTVSRRDYWMSLLWTVPVIVVLTMAGLFVSQSMSVLLWSLTGAIFAIPLSALTVRRLHDTGCEGIILWVIIIPVIGPLMLMPPLLRRGASRSTPVPAMTAFDWALLAAMLVIAAATIVTTTDRFVYYAIPGGEFEVSTVNSDDSPPTVTDGTDSFRGGTGGDSAQAVDDGDEESRPWYEGETSRDADGAVKLYGYISRYPVILRIELSRGRHNNRIVSGYMYYPGARPHYSKRYILTGQVIGDRFIVDQLNSTPRANRIEAEWNDSTGSPVVTGTFIRRAAGTPVEYPFEAAADKTHDFNH